MKCSPLNPLRSKTLGNTVWGGSSNMHIPFDLGKPGSGTVLCDCPEAKQPGFLQGQIMLASCHAIRGRHTLFTVLQVGTREHVTGRQSKEECCNL